MVFCTVTKLTKTNQNITLGPKKWIGCVRFISGTNRKFVSVPARIGAFNATRHGFLHSNKTDQNEPKHHYWVQKSGAVVSFPARIGSWSRFRPEWVHSMQPGMVFCTVTKLTKTNQNITIGSKKVDWVRSFRFRPEWVHSMQPGMVFCTVTKLTKTNQNITIGSKKVDWVRSFRSWPKSVVHFVSGPNRCIQCNPAWFFAH